MPDRSSATAAELREAVNREVHAAPLSEQALLAALADRGLDLGPDPAAAVDDVLSSDGLPDVFPLPDGRLASLRALLGGRVFTHQIAADELAHDVLHANPDLAPLPLLFDRAEQIEATIAADDGAPPVSGEQIRSIHPLLDTSRYQERGIAPAEADPDGDLLLPAGSLARLGLQAGDFVAVRLDGDALRVTPADPSALVSASAIGARLREIAATHEPVPTALAVLGAVADDAELLAVPARPLRDALDAAGLKIDGEELATAGFDFEIAALRRVAEAVADECGLDEEQAAAVAVLKSVHTQLKAWNAQLAETGGEVGAPPLDDAALQLVATALPQLTDPAVATAFAELTLSSDMADAEVLGGFVGFLLDVAPARVGVALEWLQAKAYDQIGALDQAEDALRRAESLDRRWSPVSIDLARYASDRGDAAQALALLRRAGDDPDGLIPLLQEFQPTPRPGLGRNKPCWCGSGRKYKLCHLNQEKSPLSKRARWLYRKAVLFLRDPQWRPFLMGLAESRSQHWDDRDALVRGLQDPLTTGVALFEGGVLEEFLLVRGSLLPDDELLLAQQWLLVERSLFEIQAVDPGRGFRCRDVRTGDAHEVREATASRQLAAGDLLCCLILPAGDTEQIFGGAEPVSLAQRDALIELLDSEPEPDELVELLSARFAPPTVRNADGEPFVFCESRLRVTDPAVLARGLDRLYERQTGDDTATRWCEVVAANGTESIRATLTLDGDELLVETNSEARARQVVGAIADIDPDATIVRSSQRPLAEMMDAGRRSEAAGEPRPDGPDDPEIAALLEEHVRRHEESWLDESIPALAGRTPREATDDPTRRDDLLRLLDSFPAADRPGMMDPERLRRALGLD